MTGGGKGGLGREKKKEFERAKFANYRWAGEGGNRTELADFFFGEERTFLKKKGKGREPVRRVPALLGGETGVRGKIQ